MREFSMKGLKGDFSKYYLTMFEKELLEKLKIYDLDDLLDEYYKPILKADKSNESLTMQGIVDLINYELVGENLKCDDLFWEKSIVLENPNNGKKLYRMPACAKSYKKYHKFGLCHFEIMALNMYFQNLQNKEDITFIELIDTYYNDKEAQKNLAKFEKKEVLDSLKCKIKLLCQYYQKVVLPKQKAELLKKQKALYKMKQNIDNNIDLDLKSKGR